MSSLDGLIAGFYGSSGPQIGISILGFLFIPNSQGGLVMQDSAGANWLLQIGTDGRLSTSQVTF